MIKKLKGKLVKIEVRKKDKEEGTARFIIRLLVDKLMHTFVGVFNYEVMSNLKIGEMLTISGYEGYFVDYATYIGTETGMKITAYDNPIKEVEQDTAIIVNKKTWIRFEEAMADNPSKQYIYDILLGRLAIPVREEVPDLAVRWESDMQAWSRNSTIPTPVPEPAAYVDPSRIGCGCEDCAHLARQLGIAAAEQGSTGFGDGTTDATRYFNFDQPIVLNQPITLRNASIGIGNG